MLHEDTRFLRQLNDAFIAEVGKSKYAIATFLKQNFVQNVDYTLVKRGGRERNRCDYTMTSDAAARVKQAFAWDARESCHVVGPTFTVPDGLVDLDDAVMADVGCRRDVAAIYLKKHFAADVDYLRLKQSNTIRYIMTPGVAAHLKIAYAVKRVRYDPSLRALEDVYCKAPCVGKRAAGADNVRLAPGSVRTECPILDV